MFYITGLLYYVSSTVNPILYNVMSNRYRVAFKETLCGMKRSKNGNGFSRDHSSFRETTRYDGTQLVRVRSVVGSEHLVRYSRYGSTTSSTKDKNRPQNCVQWQEDYDKQQVGLLNEENEGVLEMKKGVKRTDVVVVVKPTVNGKAKCYTTGNNAGGSDTQENHSGLNENECVDNIKISGTQGETRI